MLRVWFEKRFELRQLELIIVELGLESFKARQLKISDDVVLEFDGNPFDPTETVEDFADQRVNGFTRPMGEYISYVTFKRRIYGNFLPEGQYFYESCEALVEYARGEAGSQAQEVMMKGDSISEVLSMYAQMLEGRLEPQALNRDPESKEWVLITGNILLSIFALLFVWNQFVSSFGFGTHESTTRNLIRIGVGVIIAMGFMFSYKVRLKR